MRCRTMTQLMLGITLTLVACGPAASGGVKPEQAAAEGALSQHGTGISSGLMTGAQPYQ